MTILVSDTFTDTDATSLDAHTPDTRPGSNVWSEHSGNWKITSNKAVLTNTNSNSCASIDSGQADVSLSVLAKGTATVNNAAVPAGLAVRVTDGNNYWKVSISAAGDQFNIIERNAAVSTVRSTASLTIDTTTEYTITAQLSGASITGQVDGAHEITYGSATLNQTSTRHGLTARETADTLDNFEVSVAGGGSTTTLTADEGSFTENGQSVGFQVSMTVEHGSYS